MRPLAAVPMVVGGASSPRNATEASVLRIISAPDYRGPLIPLPNSLVEPDPAGNRLGEAYLSPPTGPRSGQSSPRKKQATKQAAPLGAQSRVEIKRLSAPISRTRPRLSRGPILFPLLLPSKRKCFISHPHVVKYTIMGQRGEWVSEFPSAFFQVCFV